ncbi:1-acyl-sn-glycerol-3-phosphate acyltransferase [Conexibacter sp. DBS9H8]|uniref:lysophospholipid acyltransferase family protein n=1 Tax=Conexibacter sp. DBS9H8 TaxID=2937801 RepID=UPI00200DA1DC|nr:lysophospholipid acyltransferase family protein [Conexibacter sp. DBS9H8]
MSSRPPGPSGPSGPSGPPAPPGPPTPPDPPRPSGPSAPRDLPISAQVYADPRDAALFAPYHERSRDHEPEWVYEAVRLLLVPVVLGLFRTRASGSENVPNGPVIIAPNHGSFMDHFLAGAFLRRHIQFMAKSQMFSPRRPATWVLTHGGIFPVRRGHRDEDAFATAAAILARGGCLGTYVEGGRSRTGTVGTQARPGIGRIALESGAPVVPVAIVGSHRIRNWRRLQFPRVRVYYGEPVAFKPIPSPSRPEQQAVADEILRRIRLLHARHEAGATGG